MEHFLEFVAEVMEKDPSEINLGIVYKEFDGWDSLMMLTLVMEIEAEYGVSIPLEKVGEVKTLADLYALTR